MQSHFSRTENTLTLSIVNKSLTFLLPVSLSLPGFNTLLCVWHILLLKNDRYKLNHTNKKPHVNTIIEMQTPSLGLSLWKIDRGKMETCPVDQQIRI